MELTDLATRAVRNVIANDLGQYAIPTLLPGRYDLKAVNPGFQATVVTTVQVEVAKATPVNIQLQLGEMTATVTVTEESPRGLQTVDSTLGEVVSAGSLENLPTVTRRVESTRAPGSIWRSTSPTPGVSQTD